MPCIQRANMPQIDMIHLEEFKRYCVDHGIDLKHEYIHPVAFRAKQCGPFKEVSPPTLAKPVLSSVDRIVLDGNNRWFTWMKRDIGLMPTLTLHLPFAKALPFLFGFVHTYHYGDGKFHPRTF